MFPCSPAWCGQVDDPRGSKLSSGRSLLWLCCCSLQWCQWLASSVGSAGGNGLLGGRSAWIMLQQKWSKQDRGFTSQKAKRFCSYSFHMPSLVQFVAVSWQLAYAFGEIAAFEASNSGDLSMRSRKFRQHPPNGSISTRKTGNICWKAMGNPQNDCHVMAPLHPLRPVITFSMKSPWNPAKRRTPKSAKMDRHIHKPLKSVKLLGQVISMFTILHHITCLYLKWYMLNKITIFEHGHRNSGFSH